MKKRLKWFSDHPLRTYLLAFGLITLPSLPLYLAAGGTQHTWVWFWIGLVICGNLLAIANR